MASGEVGSGTRQHAILVIQAQVQTDAGSRRARVRASHSVRVVRGMSFSTQRVAATTSVKCGPGGLLQADGGRGCSARLVAAMLACWPSSFVGCPGCRLVCQSSLDVCEARLPYVQCFFWWLDGPRCQGPSEGRQMGGQRLRFGAFDSHCVGVERLCVCGCVCVSDSRRHRPRCDCSPSCRDPPGPQEQQDVQLVWAGRTSPSRQQGQKMGDPAAEGLLDNLEGNRVGQSSRRPRPTLLQRCVVARRWRHLVSGPVCVFAASWMLRYEWWSCTRPSAKVPFDASGWLSTGTLVV